jgi:hypothetical protein
VRLGQRQPEHSIARCPGFKDKVLGEAERLVTKGFRHGARKLIDRVGRCAQRRPVPSC